jgi:hypothetical protein
MDLPLSLKNVIIGDEVFFDGGLGNDPTWPWLLQLSDYFLKIASATQVSVPQLELLCWS